MSKLKIIELQFPTTNIFSAIFKSTAGGKFAQAPNRVMIFFSFWIYSNSKIIRKQTEVGKFDSLQFVEIRHGPHTKN